MDKLHLMIVMPTSKVFDGEVDRIMVRSTEGEIAILPRHIDLATTLGHGEARITIDGEVKHAMINGGMMHVSKDLVRILTSHFSWKGKQS